MTNTCNSSTKEAKAGESEIQEPLLHSEFDASLGYRRTSFLNEEIKLLAEYRNPKHSKVEPRVCTGNIDDCKGYTGSEDRKQILRTV